MPTLLPAVVERDRECAGNDIGHARIGRTADEAAARDGERGRLRSRIHDSRQSTAPPAVMLIVPLAVVTFCSVTALASVIAKLPTPVTAAERRGDVGPQRESAAGGGRRSVGQTTLGVVGDPSVIGPAPGIECDCCAGRDDATWRG